MLTQNNHNKKIDKLTLNKINEVYQYLVNNKYSDFYKNKYQRAGINFKNIISVGQFESLPYLTKDEILNAGPEGFLFIPKNKVDHVGISSGTTNKDLPMILLMNSKGYPKNMLHKRFAEYYKLKIKTVMLLYSSLNILRRFQLNYELTRHGVLMVPSDLNNLTASAKVAKRLQVDAIETTPTILYHFIPYLKKEYDLGKIKLINLGGEFTSEEKYKYFQKIFKNAYFVFNFGGIELSRVGERCEYLSKLAPRFFHPSGHLYAEVLNPDKEGELVLTSLSKGTWPFIIRYKTGNSVKISDFVCPCGRKMTLELFGKIGLDVVKIQGGFIYSNHISQTLSPYYKHLKSHDFMLHVYEVIKKDAVIGRLVLQLVPKNTDDEKLKSEIKKGISDNLFLSANSTLSDLVKKKIFLPLEIEFLDILPFNPKQTSIVSHLV